MSETTRPDTEQLTEIFGSLSLAMLSETPIRHAWRLSVLVNLYTGPLFKEIMERFSIDRLGFVVLFMLDRHNGLVARDIVQATGFPKNSISRAIGGLKKREFIVDEIDLNNKRSKKLRITDSGKTIVSRILPMFEDRQNSMRSVLSDEEKVSFDHCLEKIIYGMPQWIHAGIS